MSSAQLDQHTKPYLVVNGLAVYCAGDGEPVLLLPYPHGFPTTPMIEGALAHLLCQLHYRVITFDPPGAFRSSRPATVSMLEMLQCAKETLDTLGVHSPLSVIGHSMGGLCAIAYALAHPNDAKKLMIIGSVSGGPAIARGQGMPWGMSFRNPDFWRFSWWGMRLSTGHGNLAVHKKLLRLLWKYSYVNQQLIPDLRIETRDSSTPAPLLDKWPRVARRLDYSDRLREICMPSLIGVGRFDPQAPVACSEELAHGIPKAQLVVFEHSGHYPFVEEPQLFASALSDFLKLRLGE